MAPGPQEAQRAERIACDLAQLLRAHADRQDHLHPVVRKMAVTPTIATSLDTPHPLGADLMWYLSDR